MKPNPILKKLGFSEKDRIVIIHADDLGMCQASVSACRKLFEVKRISSAAVMVPCPWFLSAAGLVEADPDIDLGVHATLTSEWKSYRWRPISTSDPESGLIDGQGYFYHSSQLVQENADPLSVKHEINAQIDSAIKQGISPTHIDTHMGTVAHPKFMFDYINAGLSKKIPPMLFRLKKEEWVTVGLDKASAEIVETFLMNLENQGIPILDGMRTIPLDQPDNRYDQAVELFKSIPVGVTHFIIHPAEDTPEIRAITPDWRARVADFELFYDENIHKFLLNEGIHVIGYQNLKNIYPQSDIIIS